MIKTYETKEVGGGGCKSLVVTRVRKDRERLKKG